MANIETLLNKNDETIYPVTKTEAVYNAAGTETLDNTLDKKANISTASADTNKMMKADGTKSLVTSSNIDFTTLAQIQSTQSSSGNANFIKYENGLAIAWRTVTTTIDINNAWGSLYRSTNIGDTWSYGVTFLEKPTINVTIETVDSQSCWISSYAGDKVSTTSLGGTAYVAVRPTSATGAQVKIHFIAMGRWK